MLPGRHGHTRQPSRKRLMNLSFLLRGNDRLVSDLRRAGILRKEAAMITAPDPSRAILLDYLLIFHDDAPPKQTELCAISDEHAVQLLRKEYRAVPWTLYRKPGGQKIFHFEPNDQ